MMNDIFTKIFSMAKPALIRSSIYMEGNSYVFFERYRMKKYADSIVVTRFSDSKKLHFSCSQHAVTWIILDKYNKFYECNRVVELDSLLESIKVDKQIHTKLKQSSNLDSYLLYSVKQDQDTYRQNKFQNEMNKYITMAKSCQERGFQNELIRTTGKQKEQDGN
jgi:hypothetical protein